MKEGTQYRSRGFMAPRDLVNEVMMYVQNGRLHGHMHIIISHVHL